MKKEKRIYLSIFWIMLGTVLITLGFMGKVDEYWNSMGFALAIVGFIQVLRFHRLEKNEAYREKMEIEASDERNKFLRSQAWSWSGYLFIIISGVAVIGFKIAGQELLSMAASYAVCLMLMLYWISYGVLKRKY